MYLFEKQREARENTLDMLRRNVEEVRAILASDSITIKALKRAHVLMDTLEAFAHYPVADYERRRINVNVKAAANWR
jgi:oligoribonuclease (3'-5' exoribonuclease)